MKNVIAAAALSAFLSATPVVAGTLTDPVVEADIVIAEAEADSANIDGLVTTVWLAMLFATMGGAL